MIDPAVSKILMPFFQKLVHASCDALRVFRNEDMNYIDTLVIEEYLARVLLIFAVSDREKSDLLSSSLLSRYFELVHGSAVPDRQKIRNVAEASLFTAGIIAPHKRRYLSDSYYAKMGEHAYGCLSEITPSADCFCNVYARFSRDLLPFVGVLQRIGYEDIFKLDLLDIVQRYLREGREADQRWLVSRGINVDLVH